MLQDVAYSFVWLGLMSEIGAGKEKLCENYLKLINFATSTLVGYMALG